MALLSCNVFTAASPNLFWVSSSLLLAQLAEYTFFLRGMFDILGNIAVGCVVAVWEGRNAFYLATPQFGKSEEKPV
jgi:hypothetical protein